MIKRALWMGTVACLFLVYSCQPKKKGSFSVNVTYKNADKLTAVAGPVSEVYLMQVPFGKDQSPVILDSSKLSPGNGSFTLSGLTTTEGLYTVVFGNDVIQVPLVNDATDVKVNIDLGKNDDFYTLSGSDASSQLKDLITLFGKKNFEVERTMADIDSLRRANAPDTVLIAATNQKNQALQELNTYLKQYLNTNNNGTLSALALSWASRSFSKAEFEGSLTELMRKYPDNVVLKGLKQNYDQQLAAMAKQDQENGASWVGKPAPELSLPDASGKNISIASFKGKYLLVDFWASWCGPCRAENPNVVAAYNEFKGKNFTVLGVSLDKEKDAWQEAVKADRLDWTQISDLKFWSSKAVETFKFNGIPFNVLIDPQGNVIAQGLRGDDLENKLKTVLAN